MKKVKFQIFAFPDPVDGLPLKYFTISVKRRWYKPWQYIVDDYRIPQMFHADTLKDWMQFYKSNGFKIVE